MAKKVDKSKTFINPGGIVEQHYFGVQTPESVLEALEDLEKCAKKAGKSNKPVLILANVTEIPKIDLGPRMLKVRKAGISTMKSIKFKKAAVYGPLPVQIMVNTMALIAGKQHRLHVFGTRVEAMSWLKEK